MEAKPIGKKSWIVPDGFIPKLTEEDLHSRRNYQSHECACIVNMGPQDAHIRLTIYFEEAPPKVIEGLVVPARYNPVQYGLFIDDGVRC